jgi:hypothetical protein
LPAASSLLHLPALRPATSVKLHLEWDVARGQNDEVLRLRRRCRDLEPWCCQLRRRRSFCLRRCLGQEKKVDSDFDASVLQLLQLALLLSLSVHLELCLLLLQQQRAVAVVVSLLLLLLRPQGQS